MRAPKRQPRDFYKLNGRASQVEIKVVFFCKKKLRQKAGTRILNGRRSVEGPSTLGFTHVLQRRRNSRV